MNGERIGSGLLRRLAVAVAILVPLFALTYLLDPFRDYQLATAAAYLCATAGLTVLTGVNGQISLGHGALMAIGAYTVAFSQNAFADRAAGSWTLVISLATGVLVTTLAGVVIGVGAARLRGPYLAGVTLAVAVAAPSVPVIFEGVFNGDQGLPVYVAPPPETLGWGFPPERWQAWIALIAASIVLVLLTNLVHSRFGRAMRAVRDNEVAARLAGISVARTQVAIFVVSAACAGLGGGLLAVLAQSVSPSGYALTLSLYLVLAIVVGGLGSLAGAVWGALLLVLLPESITAFTDTLSLSPGLAQRLNGNLPLAVFGLTLVVVMIAAPGGIHGLLRRVVARSRALLKTNSYT